jgi:hypothetical protein
MALKASAHINANGKSNVRLARNALAPLYGQWRTGR